MPITIRSLQIRDIRPLIEAAGFRTTPFLGLGLNFRVNHCMADGGSVVITPDGSLYPCEHCPAESRLGDIWNGVTDEAAKKNSAGWAVPGKSAESALSCRIARALLPVPCRTNTAARSMN